MRYGCITCGDEGVPMRVVELDDGEAVCVDQDGVSHEVAVDLLDAVRPGKRILVHAGVAIGGLT
jgi:hydrogenase assembly chaperone HypC/HupF